jgi:proline iminopeptidase
LNAYYRRLTGSDQRVALTAARAWSVWEGSTSFLHSNFDNIKKWAEDHFALAVARIECHYFVNRGFLRSEGQLLEDVARIRHIPATIVQGRYDVVCPARSAWDLHRVWPEADLRIVADAGHSAFEPGNTHELVLATDRYRSR